MPDGLMGVVQLTAGDTHTVALKSDGTVVAWGNNSSGQTTVPTGLSGVVQISACNNHTVALKSDGTVVAWGENFSGQTSVPIGLSGVVQVAAGGSHTVALKGDGTVVAWGNNSSGQTIVPGGLSGVVQIGANGHNTVALKSDGTVVVWGDNSSGQTTVPNGLADVVQVAAGGAHTVALKGDGTVVVWGSNLFGETNVPSGLAEVVQIAAGFAHTVALKSDGTIAGWGRNSNGQTTVPAGLTSVAQVAAGGLHTVALVFDSDGDGAIDYREKQDGTDPNNPESFHPLSKGLVAYYPFDGDANDESGYGSNGTASGAQPAEGRHGVAGTAYFFDGVDDEVAIQPSEPLIGIEGAVTVTAWIYNEGLGAPSFGSQDLQGIFGPATYLAWDSDGGFGLRLYDGNHDSVNSRRYSFTVGAPRQDLESASIAPEDIWDFVVATYDGNTMSIYRNGFLDASEVVGPGLTAGMDYGGNYFTIGQFVDWSAGTQRCPFHGKIDDVRVYNRALSASDVANLYHTEAGNLDSDGDGLTDAWERGFGRYSLVQGSFSWDQAKADAESRGGHLATITSDVERLSIMSQFSESLRNNVLPWLGASDAEAEGDWKWVTGEPWGFAYWSSGNPDNGGSAYPDQDYLWAGIGANSADRQQWLWDDYANSGNSIYQNGYLLEFGYPTDPLDPDTDDDSLPDGAETGTGKFVSSSNTGTRPLDPDTSGDGILDGESVAYGFDPNVDYAPVLHFLRDKGSDGGGRFGLFTEAGMMDLNLGGVVLRKSGSTVNLRLQIQSKSDLRAPSWTTEGTETFILDMPGNKAFMRIRALGPQ